MHDPLTVAFEIARPWPHRYSRILKTSGGVNIGWKRLWVVGSHEYYWPDMVIVWHVEPGGHDAGSVCGHRSHWRWHVHHYRLQLPPLQDLRRRLLTRCAWCGGRSTKANPVNVSPGWGSEKTPFWRGERNLFHRLCMSVHHAHQICLCLHPLLDHGDYGKCELCGLRRWWGHAEVSVVTHYLASLPTGATIPADKLGWVRAEWAKERQEAGSSW
jgi:hypothetical protein